MYIVKNAVRRRHRRVGDGKILLGRTIGAADFEVDDQPAIPMLTSPGAILIESAFPGLASFPLSTLTNSGKIQGQFADCRKCCLCACLCSGVPPQVRRAR
ncbi:hypothetical protein ACLJYM_05395 [Rhizobium giardinii]|uniref:hypothetical protein n=1 Tax=Rhizobium giardinii TaxID=56731 RepID=UPI000DD995B1